jgi:hypothetical protein
MSIFAVRETQRKMEVGHGAEQLAEEERRIQGRYYALRRRRRVDRLVSLCADVLARHLGDVESLEGIGEGLVVLIWLHFLHQPRPSPRAGVAVSHAPATIDELTQQTRAVVLRGLASDLYPWAEDMLAFAFVHAEGFSETQLVGLLAAAQPVINNTPLVGEREGQRQRREMLTQREAEQVLKRFKKSAVAYFFCGGGTKGKKKEKKDSPNTKKEEEEERDLFKKAKKRHHHYETDKWQIREDRRDQLLALISKDRMNIYVHVLRCACFSMGKSNGLIFAL